MEALGLVRPAGGPVAWRRPPAKPENFIARNKILVRDSSRKQRLTKTTASSVPQQRKPCRTAAAHQRKPKEASPPREAEGSVLVSKQYLEELLRFKVHNSVALSTKPDPPPLAVVPSSSSRVGWPREEAQAEGDHRSKAPPSSAVVEYNRTDIPGLGRHEGEYSSLALSQVEGGEGPWQSTPCKSQEGGSHFSGRGLPCQEPEGEEYFPWGRPGGGAPLLRSSGRRCAPHVADSGRAQGLQSVKGTAMSHDRSHDRSHDMCKSNAIPPRPVPTAMRCSISITGVGDDQSEKEKKQAEQRRWLQDLQDQIQAKKTSRSLAVPPAGSVDNVGGPRSSGSTAGSPGEVGMSPVSPREEHFGRGAGPHVDQFALRDKEDRRRRELENREYLKAQVEEKCRQKEEERRRREEEARLEDERVAVEQARLQAEYQREREKAVRKEEEALRRHALLQERLSEAQQAAAEAKQKRVRRGSPQQWEGGAGGRDHDHTGGRETSTINIVIGEEQTPPTNAARVSPFPASVDHTDGADRLSHSSLRSPSLLMFDPALIHEAPPPTKKHVKDVVVDPGMKERGGRVSRATGGGGRVSRATTGGGGHVSKTTGGGGRASKATGGGGHVSKTTGGGGRVSQSTGSKLSAKTAEVVSGPQHSACRPVGPNAGATQKRTAVQQPGGHKPSERRVRAIPQQPGGPKCSKAQGRPAGEVLSGKNTLEGPKCLSVSSPVSPVYGAQASGPVGGGLLVDHQPIRSQAVSPPVPALRKKLGALPQAPPPDTPPLLEAHTEHQPVGLDEERGGAQFKLPGLARHKCVITSGVGGGQGQMGVVLSTLANLKQSLLSAEQKDFPHREAIGGRSFEWRPSPAGPVARRAGAMEGGHGVGGEGGGEEGAAESKRRRAKSGPSTYHRLEDQINLQHLEELMEVFHKADENGSDGLDIDEFKSAFGEILGQGKSDQQMAIMFMKIDTNCDGTVDWDEFCTYMLLEYQEKDSMTRGGRMPYPHPLRTVTSPHREVLSAVRHMPTAPQTAADHSVAVGSDGGRYITAGQDGCVCVWKSNLSLTRTIQLEPVRQKTIFVTDLVPLPNVNKFVAASTENVLICYDLSAASDPQQVISGLPHSVVAMDYWYSMKDPNQSVLLLGDTGGRVTVLEFSKASQGLFLSQDGSKLECSSLTFDELLMGRVEGVRMHRFTKLHNEWVQCVRYCPALEGLFSASTDPRAPLVLADVRGKSCLGKSVFRIDKGVNSFDYSEAWNVIATGGLDSIVRLWNPYVPAKPTATLQGHTTAILFIAIADTHNHLLSFSKDKELRVWDLQDQGCLQVVQRFGKLGTQVPYAYCLNHHNSLLLLATSQLAVLEPSSGGEFFGCHDVSSHSKPLCAALYNANFNQVVSGCHGGTVSVWDVDTGSKIMQFSQAHGEAEITAMSFDPSGRRLITGGRDGTVKIWNFNNGACLSVLHNEDTAEVTSVVCLKQRIVVGGWNRRLAMYSDTRGSRAAVPKYWAEQAHCEDILCMAHSPPNLLVSASYDGDIILWNADCERKLCRMNAKSYLHQQPQPGGEGEGSSGSVCTEEKRGQAVEQMLLLLSRDPLPTAATLVTCGEGGWVRFWSVYGLGLAGEFSVFSPGEGCGMESVTSCCATSTNCTLFTGDSSGYVKAWDIERYCLEVHPEVCRDAPPLLLSFRAHLKNIVSLCVAEGRGLLVSASTDCCVRLWTMQGRFIGTFGEKWHLSYPLQTSQLPQRVPPDISNSASFNTLNVTSGPPTSKWILARNLFRALRRQVMGPSAPDVEGCAARLAEEDGEEIKRRVLGKFYKRKTRPRQLLQPMKVQQSGHHVLPFTTLQCSELRQTEEFHLPPIRQSRHHGNSSNHDSDAESSPSRPKALTLVDVLPEVAHREATSGAKPSAGWPLHQAPLPTAHASRALRRNGMLAM